MSTINTFINSLPGQFLIGGITVAGINYFSNNIANSAIAGVIASVPVGLPSTIFVKDAKGKNFRHDLYKDYKATREKMPDNLKSQIDDIEKMVKLMNVEIVAIP